MTLQNEAAKAKLLADMVRDMLGPDDDLSEVLSNTIEGESDFFEYVDKMMMEALLAEAQAESIKAVKADLDQRKKRLEERAERIKQVVCNVWAEIGVRDKEGKLQSIKRPAFTLSFPWQKSRLVIDDVDMLPDDCVTTETKVIKKANAEAIDAKISAGENVAGCHMSNGYQGISVRTK